MNISPSKYLPPILPSTFFWVCMFVIHAFFFGIVLLFNRQYQVHRLSENLSLPYSDSSTPSLETNKLSESENMYLDTFKMDRSIRVKDFFQWMDSIVLTYDSITERKLSELHLIHANPWIMTRLIDTDYYIQKKLGNQIPNQREMVILHKEDSLRIPSEYLIDSIMTRINCMVLDVNIPEYTLRILEQDTVIYQFSVRVGRRGTRFLPYLKREIRMQTIIGEGQVIQKLRDPIFINFKTGKQYMNTRRDDGYTTRMPLVPAIIPEINGIPSNQVIHATTNPNTLGKAYSHGCIGINEPAAWIVYYYSIIGTPVIFRYDLWISNDQGDSIYLEDIYELHPIIQ